MRATLNPSAYQSLPDQSFRPFAPSSPVLNSSSHINVNININLHQRAQKPLPHSRALQISRPSRQCISVPNNNQVRSSARQRNIHAPQVFQEANLARGITPSCHEYDDVGLPPLERINGGYLDVAEPC